MKTRVSNVLHTLVTALLLGFVSFQTGLVAKCLILAPPDEYTLPVFAWLAAFVGIPVAFLAWGSVKRAPVRQGATVRMPYLLIFLYCLLCHKLLALLGTTFLVLMALLETASAAAFLWSFIVLFTSRRQGRIPDTTRQPDKGEVPAPDKHASVPHPGFLSTRPSISH